MVTLVRTGGAHGHTGTDGGRAVLQQSLHTPPAQKGLEFPFSLLLELVVHSSKVCFSKYKSSTLSISIQSTSKLDFWRNSPQICLSRYGNLISLWCPPSWFSVFCLSSSLLLILSRIPVRFGELLWKESHYILQWWQWRCGSIIKDFVRCRKEGDIPTVLRICMLKFSSYCMGS